MSKYCIIIIYSIIIIYNIIKLTWQNICSLCRIFMTNYLPWHFVALGSLWCSQSAFLHDLPVSYGLIHAEIFLLSFCMPMNKFPFMIMSWCGGYFFCKHIRRVGWVGHRLCRLCSFDICVWSAGNLPTVNHRQATQVGNHQGVWLGVSVLRRIYLSATRYQRQIWRWVHCQTGCTYSWVSYAHIHAFIMFCIFFGPLNIVFIHMPLLDYNKWIENIDHVNSCHLVMPKMTFALFFNPLTWEQIFACINLALIFVITFPTSSKR